MLTIQTTDLCYALVRPSDQLMMMFNYRTDLKGDFAYLLNINRKKLFLFTILKSILLRIREI